MITFRCPGLILLTACLALTARVAAAGNYDPLAVPSGFQARRLDLVGHDAKRDRDIPVLLYLPTNPSRVPVVQFSHGLGGARAPAASS